MEYASAEAVRRGGGGPRPKLDERTGPRKGPSHGGHSGGSERGGGKVSRSGRGDREGQRKDPRVEIGDPLEDAASKDEDIAPKVSHAGRPHSGADKSGYKGVKGRSKPGAALALAKRESAAIVASQGQKITF